MPSVIVVVLATSLEGVDDGCVAEGMSELLDDGVSELLDDCISDLIVERKETASQLAFMLGTDDLAHCDGGSHQRLI